MKSTIDTRSAQERYLTLGVWALIAVLAALALAMFWQGLHDLVRWVAPWRVLLALGGYAFAVWAIVHDLRLHFKRATRREYLLRILGGRHV